MPSRRSKNMFTKKHDYRNASIGPSVRYEGGTRRRTSGSYSSRNAMSSHSGMGGRGSQAGRNSRTGRSARTGMGSRDLDFNSSRTNRRAKRGEISHVIPNTRTRESAADFSRRSARRGLDNNFGTASRLKTFIFGIVALALAVLMAFFVGSCVYTNAVNGKMGLQDGQVKSVLVQPESKDDPYYVLLAGCYSEGRRNHGADMLMLVRVDEAKKTAAFINVPGNMVVNGKRVGILQRSSGDAVMIEQVSDALGVDIAHYVRIDSEGFVKLIDGFGGIEVNLTEEVDDPDTGDLYIPAGKQVMDGATALVYVRANNYAGGNATRAAKQVDFLKLVLKKVLAEQSRASLDSFASCIQTDYTADDALKTLAAFADAKVSKFHFCTVPGYDTEMNKVVYFYPYLSNWEQVKAKVEAGKDPSAVEKALDTVKTGNYKIEIRNGSGINGAAAEAKGMLKKVGFRVGKVGNTETSAYGETLVIYKKDKNAKAAQAVVESLGVGRIVQNSIYYTFKTDILVIIGKDWRLEG